MNALFETLSNNTAGAYALAVVTFAVGVALALLLKSVFDRSLKTSGTLKSWRVSALALKVIERHVLLLLYFAAFYVAVYTLNLHPKAERVVDVSGLVVLSFFAARILSDLASDLLSGYRIADESGEGRVPRGVITLVKAVIWGIVAAFLLDNLGFNITALVAGVGIGGIAVAMASQAILGDLFSYFVILFDRPFAKGDFIVVGDKAGAVEYIGIKTTRIRSISGEELVFSNNDLTNSRVHNYKKMEKRRVAFTVGVTYETPTDKLEKIPRIVKGIIDGIEDAAFDRAHFSSFGDFALMFEIVYHVNSADYATYMNIQQRINLEIKDALEQLGAAFAYPTQTLYLQSEGDGRAGR